MRRNEKNNDEKFIRWSTGPVDFRSKAGMEMVQVGILIAIAIGIGLIFKTQITDFVNSTFDGLAQF